MQLQLTTLDSPNAQPANQNPQSSVGGGLANVTNGNVQSGDTSDLFNTGSGISLSSTSLPSVNLGTATVQSNSPTIATVKHNFDAAWLVIPIALVIIAVAVFWRIQATANNTTD